MTLALDTTGLLARYLEGPTHAVAVQAMNSDPDWCASALVLSEAMMLMDRLGLDAEDQIIGFLYIGTRTGGSSPIPRPQAADFVTSWNG